MKLFHRLKKKTVSNPHATHSVLHRIGRDPYIDWPIVFAFSLSVGVVLVIVGVSVYFSVDRSLSGEVTIPVIQVQDETDVKNLKDVISEFEKHKKNTTSLENGYAGASDPSK